MTNATQLKPEVLEALNLFQAGLNALEEVNGINGDIASDLLGDALYKFGLDYEQFSELQEEAGK